MIPVLAALLKLFFIKNKSLYFVDHAVFALHLHSFVFIISLLGLMNPFEAIQEGLFYFTVLLFLLYFIIAIHRTYKSGWIRSVLIGLGSTALYIGMLLFATVADIWILVLLKS